MAEENKFILDVDVKPLKAQLKEATKDLQAARQKFGEFSEEAIQAAQRVATIRDEIEDANEQAQQFDPGKRFQALTTAATTAAAGVAAVQGAMALFGDESENVAKTLAKVQGALALSQGLSQLKDIGKVGAALKTTFAGLTAGANQFKKALISTGIGALVVAVGLLVAYWEDIKGLVSGVSSEQDKLNQAGKDNLQTQQDKLTALDGQTNRLKLQGKSEREILQMKIKQTEEGIAAAKVVIQNAKITRDTQVAAAKRNKDILQGLINLVSIPITVILAGIDEIGKAFGKNFNLLEGFTGGLANLVFDPEQVAKDGDKAIKEAESTLETLEESKASSQLQIQAIDKAAGEKSTERANKQREKELEAQKILNDAKTSLLSKQQQEEEAVRQSYAEKFKKLAEAGMKDDGTLEAAKQKELNAIRDNYRKEEEDKVKAYEKQLADIRTETRLAGIKDENERAEAEILANYEKERLSIDENEKLTAEQKTQLKLALKEQEELALKSLDDKIKAQKIADDIAELDKEIAKSNLSFQIQYDLLNKKDALLKEQFDKGLIKEKEYNDGVEANANARIEIGNKETQARLDNASKVAGLLGNLSNLFGKQSAAGKAFAIGQATIDTYLAAVKAYQSMSGIPVVGPALGVVAAGAAIAGGIKNIREIIKVKTPGGGSNVSAPSVSAPSPQVAPQLPTVGNSPITSIEKIVGNQKPLKAYVVESEVTGTQKRVSDIERRAGF